VKILSYGLAAAIGACVIGAQSLPAQEEVPTVKVEEGTETLAPETPVMSEDSVEGGAEDATDLGPAATERRLQELRRLVKDDISRGNWERARRNLGELVLLRKFDADYQVSLGLVFRRLGNLPEARRKYRDYIETNGNPALASLLIAESFAQEKQPDKALEHLEKAAEGGMNVMRAASQFSALEPFTTDTRFIRLALKLENYEVLNAGRPDPFTPRAATNEIVESVDLTRKWSRGQQESILAQARDDLKRIEFALRSQNEEQAMQSYKKLQEKVPYLEHFTEPDLSAEFRSILDRLAKIEELIHGLRLNYLYDEARAEIEMMERAFRNRDFPLVDKIRGEVEGWSATWNRPTRASSRSPTRSARSPTAGSIGPAPGASSTPRKS
jgi:tetratricopeptide (TPR) repeat protein